jgi:hypothetical protein
MKKGEMDGNDHYHLTYGCYVLLTLLNDRTTYMYCDGFIRKQAIAKKIREPSAQHNVQKALFQIYPTFMNTFKKEATNLEATFAEKNYNEKKRREILQDLEDKVTSELKFDLQAFEKIVGTPVVFGQPVQLMHVDSCKFLSYAIGWNDTAEDRFELELADVCSDSTVFRMLPSYKYQQASEGIVHFNEGILLLAANASLSATNAYVFMQEDHHIQAPQLGHHSSNPAPLASKPAEKPSVFKPADQPQANQHQPALARALTHMAHGHTHSAASSPMRPPKPEYEATEFDPSPFGLNRGALNLMGENASAAGVTQAQKSVSLPMVKRDRTIRISFDESTRWAIRFSATHDADNQLLHYGDIIWLHHSETNLTLVAEKLVETLRKSFLDPRASENLRTPDPGPLRQQSIITPLANQFEKMPLDGLRINFVNSQEISINQQFIGNTNGMWLIERLNLKNGGRIRWGEKLRLKHLGSGMYLSIQEKETDLEQRYELSLTASPNHLSEWEFEMIFANINQSNSLFFTFVSRDSFVFLKNAALERWLQLALERPEQVGSGLDAVHPYHLSKEFQNRDAFKIFRANTKEVWETNFLISCAPILTEFIEHVCLPAPRETEKKMIARFDTLKHCLKEMENFVQDRSSLSLSTTDYMGDAPNRVRQKILRELYFIEVLIIILRDSLKPQELLQVSNPF